jgi:hypothetical protein
MPAAHGGSQSRSVFVSCVRRRAAPPSRDFPRASRARNMCSGARHAKRFKVAKRRAARVWDPRKHAVAARPANVRTMRDVLDHCAQNKLAAPKYFGTVPLGAGSQYMDVDNICARVWPNVAARFTLHRPVEHGSVWTASPFAFHFDTVASMQSFCAERALPVVCALGDYWLHPNLPWRLVARLWRGNALDFARSGKPQKHMVHYVVRSCTVHGEAVTSVFTTKWHVVIGWDIARVHQSRMLLKNAFRGPQCVTTRKTTWEVPSFPHGPFQAWLAAAVAACKN